MDLPHPKRELPSDPRHRPDDGVLRPNDARTLRLFDAHGRLIGNTARHYGNISLVLVHDDWHLSPANDMLPMLYMPLAGEVVAQELGVEKMVPTARTLDVWSEVQKLALAFWQAVAQDERISGEFRNLARGNAVALAAVLRISKN